MREIDEIKTSGRRRIIVGVVAFAAIAVGVTLVFGRKGIGAPEQDHRVLIVEDRTVGLEHYAGQLGFEAISGSYEAWQDKVAEEDEGPAAAEVDLAELLKFADTYGYGYVVVENPQRFADELAELDSEGDAVAEARFAVLSIGDFASPHALSVEPPAEGVEFGPGPRMLRALFAQPRLAETLEASAASSEIQGLRLKLDRALETHAELIRVEREAKIRRAELEEEFTSFARVGVAGDAGKARPLHRALEGASTYVLADGRVVLRRDHLAFAAANEPRLSLRSSSDFVFEVIPADQPAAADVRVACPELLGGGGRRGSVARMAVSAPGDAVFVLDREGQGTLFEHDPDAGPCGLRERGTLELPDRTKSHFVATRGAVATRALEDGELRVEVHRPGAERLVVPVAVDEDRVDRVSSLVWLDPRRLVVLVELSEHPALVFVDLDAPRRPLIVALRDPADPERRIRARELQALPGGDPALVLRWQLDERYQLSRLDFAAPWAELFAEDAPEGAAQPSWTSIASVDGHIRGFDLHPEGGSVAMTHEGDLGVDLSLVSIPAPGGAAGTVVPIIDDVHEHREVEFRPGSDELLFRTRIRLEDLDASLLAVHAVDIGL